MKNVGMSNLFDIPGRGVGLSNLFERAWVAVSNEFDSPV